MAKYPVKKIESEKCFASEAQTHDGEILVRFRKSGQIYRFSRSLWSEGLKAQAEALSDADLTAAGNEILASANKAIEENRNDDKFVRKLRGVRASAMPYGDSDEDSEALDVAWAKLLSNYEGELADPNFKWNDERAAEFEKDMVSPMARNFLKLDPTDGALCVKADTGVEGFDQAYFTTDHHVSNGVEHWFLAICPIAWFGQAVSDFD